MFKANLKNDYRMKSEIKITNQAGMAVIDIEGVIGVPEKMQFEHPGQRVATYARFTDTLKELNSLEAAEITVNIRSTGGDVNDALLIYDALMGSGAVVTTRCTGYVASAATIIAQAASPGKREISSGAMYLIHCSESAAEGNYHSLTLTKNMLEATDARIARIYASRSGRDEKGFVELMNENGARGRWLSAQEAVDAGLADVVIQPGGDSDRVVNFTALDSMFEMLGLPRLPGMSIMEEKRIPETNRSKFLIWLREFIARLGGKDGGNVQSDKAKGTETQSDGVVGSSVALPVNRSRILHIRTAQDSAQPTMTMSKEDPSPSEYRRTANEMAYDSDAYELRRG